MSPSAEPKACALYVHVPWCVKKCPYCDFNSHAVRDELPEARYVDALLEDLAVETSARPFDDIGSVFIGGGTPSLLSGDAVARLIEGIRGRLSLGSDCEITLEANPGTVEAGRFEAFRRAGVNRLSVGVQSFDDDLLRRIRRIHDGAGAHAAIRQAMAAGFEAVNLDLMYGLPGQTGDQAAADVEAAIGYGPAHISHYQLTIEPNTLFHRRPPVLPGEDLAWGMHQRCRRLLADAGYRQYEISAYARPGGRCRHNLNYWRFGDYLGIGAGAHGKLTPAGGGLPVRSLKHRHPRAYLDGAASGRFDVTRRTCEAKSLPLEFMMNALRLIDGVELTRFTETTTLPLEVILPQLEFGRERGLLEESTDRLQPTPQGFRFLNELLLLFARADTEAKTAVSGATVAVAPYAATGGAVT